MARKLYCLEEKAKQIHKDTCPKMYNLKKNINEEFAVKETGSGDQ